MAPRPLNLDSSTRYSLNYGQQSLTPRTPRSRAGRVEARGVLELDYTQEPEDEDHQTYAEQQSEPLLASSASASFPPSVRRNRGVKPDPEVNRKGRLAAVMSLKLALARMPLVLGSITAVFLLLMIVLSVKKPDVLHTYIIGNSSHPLSEAAEKDAAETKSSIPAAPATSAAPQPQHAGVHKLSYANYTHFPLKPVEYLAECNKVQASMGRMVGGYWYAPPQGSMDVEHHDKAPTTHLPEQGLNKVCSSTITYMLDGYVGLAADVALMAQFAGLAREQNRTFLVNDEYWNRGKWTDHFQDVRQRQPGPEPGCFRPPPEELVACPRTARHWVVNSRTAKHHLGHHFQDEFEDAYAHSTKRLQPIFERAAKSLSQTIRPNAHNAALIRLARNEVASAAPTQPSPGDVGRYIGIHIRRGDRKAESWPHIGEYVPIEEYNTAASKTWERLTSLEEGASVVWLASDSPEVQSNFSALAQTPHLFSLAQSKDAQLRGVASESEYVQKEFNELGLDERVKATRGAVVDFAMISGAWVWGDDVQPMATICTLSSNMCKLAAVGLGWDRAFGFVNGGGGQAGDIDDSRKRWVEIDNKGNVEPQWRAFDLF